MPTPGPRGGCTCDCPGDLPAELVWRYDPPLRMFAGGVLDPFVFESFTLVNAGTGNAPTPWQYQYVADWLPTAIVWQWSFRCVRDLDSAIVDQLGDFIVRDTCHAWVPTLSVTGLPGQYYLTQCADTPVVQCEPFLWRASCYTTYGDNFDFDNFTPLNTCQYHEITIYAPDA